MSDNIYPRWTSIVDRQARLQFRLCLHWMTQLNICAMSSSCCQKLISQSVCCAATGTIFSSITKLFHSALPSKRVIMPWNARSLPNPRLCLWIPDKNAKFSSRLNGREGLNGFVLHITFKTIPYTYNFGA